MGAQLAATVYVRDPETNQTATLDPGTLPEPRLAALVTNPVAWVDRKLPRLPKAQTQSKPDKTEGPTGDGPDDASGAASARTDGSDPTPEGDNQAAPAAKKTAAKKAAPRPARGRDAAGEGSSGE
jgi:hypothetical protein